MAAVIVFSSNRVSFIFSIVARLKRHDRLARKIFFAAGCESPRCSQLAVYREQGTELGESLKRQPGRRPRIYNTQAMSEAEQAQKYVRWRKDICKDLQRHLQVLIDDGQLPIDRELLMLLALEPRLLESLRRRVRKLPLGSMREFCLDFRADSWNDNYRGWEPPTDEALLATAMELAHIVNNSVSFGRLFLHEVPADMASSVLEACSRFKFVRLEHCTLAAAITRSLFSSKAREINIERCVLSDSDESVNAFCLVLENSSVESLSMTHISIPHGREAQVATALANNKALVHFHCMYEVSRSFCDDYCAALSNNFDTKLERLCFHHGNHLALGGLNLTGDQGTVRDVDAQNEVMIRNLLKWNVQRKTCPPLFAAIGNAGTDAKRKQCLVKAFEAVDIPVVFEYITANQDNLIELIQRLGRQRED